MKIKHYMMAALVLISSCMVSSCKDDDNDNNGVAKAVLASASSLTFEGLGSSPQIITVYSDATWTAEVPDWVTISPVTGSGTTEVTVSVTENLRDGTLNNPRKDNLVFKGNTIASRATVLVSQTGDNYRDCKDYTVEQLYSAEDETYMSIPNALVVVPTSRGAMISNSDFKNFIFVETSEALEAGDNVSIMAQKLTDTQSLAYVVAEEVTVNSKNNTIDLPDATDIAEKFDEYSSDKRSYVAVEGILNGSVITVTGASMSLTLVDVPSSIDIASLSGHVVRVNGFFAGIAAPYVRMYVASAEDLGEAQTIYFSDDLEWLAPWSAVGNGSPAGRTVEVGADDNACQLATPKIDGVSAYDALVAKGYEIPIIHADGKSDRTPGTQTYLQTNYLKFGLTAYQCGLTLPSITGIESGATVHISFQWCPMVQGSGTKDPTTLVVIVANGDNEVMYDVDPHGITADEPLRWVDADITLTGATINENTKITIRNSDDQWPHTSTRRWFLDNIKVYSPMM